MGKRGKLIGQKVFAWGNDCLGLKYLHANNITSDKICGKDKMTKTCFLP